MKSPSLSDEVAGAEGARRATGTPAIGAGGSIPDPAVSEKAKRRRFTAEYRLRILREVEQCKAPGEIGVILMTGRVVFLPSDLLATTARPDCQRRPCQAKTRSQGKATRSPA